MICVVNQLRTGGKPTVARCRRYRERQFGDLHAERWKDDTESDGCSDGDGVGGESGELSASVANLDGLRDISKTIGTIPSR